MRAREREDKVGDHTFGSIRGLVVRTKPSQVLVLNPGHPVLVLVVISVFDPFGVCLLALLVVGQAFVDGFLLVI